MKQIVRKQKSEIMKDNSEKLNKLILIKFSTLARYNVFNYSERQLAEQESFELSFGFNFYSLRNM